MKEICNYLSSSTYTFVCFNSEMRIKK